MLRFLSPDFAQWLLVGCLLTAGSGCRLFHGDVEVVRADGSFDRKSAVELNRKGCRALEKGHLDKAERLLEEAVLADQSYGIAHNNLGLVHFEKGDLYSAAWSFERASLALPERPEPMNNLGNVYEAAGRIEEAISQYDMAHELAPQNPEYLGNLLRARRSRGDLDPSVEQQLQQLVFVETRPQWREWAQDQLMLFLPKEIRRLSADEESDELEVIPPAGAAGTSDQTDAGPVPAQIPPVPATPLPPAPAAIELIPPELEPTEPQSRLRMRVDDE